MNLYPVNYLLFFFTAYEGTGGWEDFKGGFSSIPFAKRPVDAKKMNKDGYTNAHIVDLANQKIILVASEPEWKWRPA